MVGYKELISVIEDKMMILMIKLDPKDRDDGFLKTHPVLAAGSFLWAISVIEGAAISKPEK